MDDEKYLHALQFPKEYVVKQAESVLQISLGDYYIEGPKDGYPVEQEKLGEVVVQMGANKDFIYDD
jgi:hypothetical protein